MLFLCIAVILNCQVNLKNKLGERNRFQDVHIKCAL